jgi:hypothetical protein
MSLSAVRAAFKKVISSYRLDSLAKSISGASWKKGRWTTYSMRPSIHQAATCLWWPLAGLQMGAGWRRR